MQCKLYVGILVALFSLFWIISAFQVMEPNKLTPKIPASGDSSGLNGEWLNIASSPPPKTPPPKTPPPETPPPKTPAATTGFVHLDRPEVLEVGSAKYGNNFPLATLQALYTDRISTTAAKEKIWSLVRTTLPRSQRKRILVTGGAGFVGSHLVDRLMLMGHYVIVLDNFFTGNRANIQHWDGHAHFEWRNADVTEPLYLEVDQIYHLACPASPPHYQYNPIKTLKTSTLGTINMLGLAKRVKARFLLTSTSEVYGDPEINPQPESYWGHVNPIGPRACYDEGKRVAETFTYAYQQETRTDVRVARIFNTFGPRMHENDGRVVSNFIIQAINGADITIYGTGAQTRSFQYVHDLVDGLMALMNQNYTQPVNLGNPDEYSIKEFASFIKEKVDSKTSKIVNLPATTDDPQQRRPDITVAKKHLDWEPRFSVAQGILETIQYFKRRLSENDL